jgi:hypothetical protein
MRSRGQSRRWTTSLRSRERGACDVAHRLELVWSSGLVLKNGFPEASTRGIRAVLVDWAGFTARTVPNFVTFMKRGADVAEQCAVTYSLNEPQVSAESTTKMVLDGC